MINVEFILALESSQQKEIQTFAEPITLAEALPAFTLYKLVQKLVPEKHYGVFNQPVSLNYLLKDGDRIEVYRPLKIDPKMARKIRADRKNTPSK